MSAITSSISTFILAATLIACGENSTRVELTVNADAAWQLDDYQLRVATPATMRSARSDALPSLSLVVPDDMAGSTATIEVWGLAIGNQTAYGTAMVTPTLHGTVSATVTLNAVSCGLWCESGDVACDHDGVTECKQDASGCFAWSAPIACPTDMPYCSNGTCAAECSDECTTGDAVCDSAVALRTCGQFDSDSCLDQSAAMACPGGESCSAGMCSSTMTCAGDGAGCDDGNACTVDDTCDGGVCSGSPKCTAPAHAQATCANDGTCGFTCDPGYAKSDASCAFVPPAALPGIRTELATVAGPDGRIYVIGGKTINGRTNTVLAYEPGTNTWTTRAPMPTARSGLAAVLGPDGRIYAIGGETAAGELATLEVYDTVTNTWSARRDMPTPRYYVAAAVGSDGRIYAIGGDANSSSSLTAVEAYDPTTNTWAAVAALPVPRSGVAAVAGPDGRIYAMGGENGLSLLNAVYMYNPSTNTWTQRAVMPTPRSFPAAALGPDSRIYALGGITAKGSSGVSYSATLEAYDPATNTWASRAPMPTERESLGAAQTIGHIYAIGGDANLLLDVVEAYDPVSNTWH